MPPVSRWKRLKFAHRVGLVCAAIVLPCCGGLAILGAVNGDSDQPDSTTQARDQSLTEVPGQGGIGAEAPAGTGTQAPGDTQAPAGAGIQASTAAPASTGTAALKQTVVTSRTVTERRAIRYSTRRVDDSSLAKGKERVRVQGRTGVRTRTYRVTFTDGRQTARTLVSNAVTRRPVTRVVAVGTKRASNCDSNYSGCVPVASDVDCAGGSGDGPAYVSGIVRVVGSDVYDLDRDNDGYGCD
jgi:hypothetical protein